MSLECSIVAFNSGMSLAMRAIMNLRHALPVLVPKAVQWAETHSRLILGSGRPLSEQESQVARAVGVTSPELIRVLDVSKLPMPEDPILYQAAVATGMLGPNMVGLTLGHGIYICHGHCTLRLISHELRHVYQYEQAGSITAFLGVYLEQIVTSGYQNAPLEIDARNHEAR